MIDIQVLIETFVYLIIGVLFFVGFIVVLEKATPWSLKKEILEDENVALGIIIGCMLLSLALIIVGAIHG